MRVMTALRQSLMIAVLAAAAALAPTAGRAFASDQAPAAASPAGPGQEAPGQEAPGWRRIVERAPVFVLAGPDGAPLLLENQVAGVFLEPGDAEAFLALLRLRDPKPPAGVRVMATSLEKVMQSMAAGALAVAFIPKESNVAAARSIKRSDSFREAPVFVVQVRGDGKPGFVTTRQADEDVVLAFLDYPDAVRHADKVRAAQGPGSGTVFVGVAGLAGFLDAARRDPSLGQVRIVPSTAARAAAALRQD